MRQLLWKEWRERRIWLLCWGALISGIIACGAGSYFLGSPNSDIGWATPWLMIISMFVGAGAYASELAPGRAAFAYSRPVSWQALLLSKLLPALACAVAAVVLGVLLFRLLCPAPYLPFISAGHLALGALQLCWMVAGNYLCGLACSVVLPGIAGGVLTLTCTVLIMFAAGMIINLLPEVDGSFWFYCGWQCGVLLAAMLLLRFGVTLPTPMRIARYARYYLLVTGCAVLLALALPEHRLATMLGQYHVDEINTSPSGRYALVSYPKSATIPTLITSLTISGGTTMQYLLRLSDGAAWKPNFPTYCWASDALCYYYESGSGSHRLFTHRLDARGSLTSQQLNIGPTFKDPLTVLSPDQRYLLIVEPGGEHRLACVELSTLRILPLAMKGVINSWWQSAHEIGYVDFQHGRSTTRHIIDLTRLPGGGL